MRSVPPKVLQLFDQDLEKASSSPTVKWIDSYRLQQLGFYLVQNDYVNAREHIKEFPTVRKLLSREVLSNILLVMPNEKAPGLRLSNNAKLSATLSPATSRALLLTSWPIQAGAKHGSYVSLKGCTPESRMDLTKKLLAAGPWPMSMLSPDSWHITLCYSQGVKLDHAVHADTCCEEPVQATITSVALWRDHKDRSLLVALIDQEGPVTQLHEKWLAAGAVHTYKPYQPHITLGYDTDYELEQTAEGQAKIYAFNRMLAGQPLTMTFCQEQLEDLK